MKTEESISTMDDIIFEKRNKLYGAYELRRNYHQRLFKAFIISICFMITVFLFSRIKKVELSHEIFTPPVKEKVEFKDDYYVVQPELQQNHSTQHNDQPDEHAFLAVTDTVENVVLKDTVTATSSTTASTSGEVGGDSTGTSSEIPFVVTPPAVRSMASVDKIPEFPGGIEKFYTFLLNRIHYTFGAQEAGVKGKLYVRFVIDEEGFVRNVTLENRIGYGLDEQVKSVLNDSPRWAPGTVKNSAVKTEMVLPVSFSIK